MYYEGILLICFVSQLQGFSFIFLFRLLIWGGGVEKILSDCLPKSEASHNSFSVGW